MSTIKLTAGDTLPTRLTYKTSKGVIIDITGYSFAVKIAYTPTPLNRACTLADPANGVIEIPWQAGDLVVGTYDIEMFVTDAAAKTKTHKLGQVIIDSRIV